MSGGENYFDDDQYNALQFVALHADYTNSCTVARAGPLNQGAMWKLSVASPSDGDSAERYDTSARDGGIWSRWVGVDAEGDVEYNIGTPTWRSKNTRQDGETPVSFLGVPQDRPFGASEVQEGTGPELAAVPRSRTSALDRL